MTHYAFDLDGTVTKVETLPLLAKELGLAREMEILTKLTLEGKFSFDESFRHRFEMLKDIPLNRIRGIMAKVPLDDDIAGFISDNTKMCAIITGNLDLWIEPIVKKLGCLCFSSIGSINNKGIPELVSVIDKGDALRQLKNSANRVIAIGDSINDLPMFKVADISVAYGGVHSPMANLASAADYIAKDGAALVKLLQSL